MIEKSGSIRLKDIPISSRMTAEEQELAAGMVDADGADGFGDALVGLLAENFGAAGGESGTMGVRFG